MVPDSTDKLGQPDCSEHLEGCHGSARIRPRVFCGLHSLPVSLTLYGALAIRRKRRFRQCSPVNPVRKSRNARGNYWLR